MLWGLLFRTMCIKPRQSSSSSFAYDVVYPRGADSFHNQILPPGYTTVLLRTKTSKAICIYDMCICYTKPQGKGFSLYKVKPLLRNLRARHPVRPYFEESLDAPTLGTNNRTGSKQACWSRDVIEMNGTLADWARGCVGVYHVKEGMKRATRGSLNCRISS